MFAQVTIDSYPDANRTGVVNFSATVAGMGQIFTSASDAALTGCAFTLAKVNSPTGNAIAKIYLVTGTPGTNAVPTGTALASSDPLDVSTLTTTPTVTSFTFSGDQFQLTNGTAYAIVVEHQGDATNRLSFGIDTSSPAHAGNRCILTSGNWSSSVNDGIFYVYSDNTVWSYVQDFNALSNGDLNTQDSWSGDTDYDVQATTVFEGTRAVTAISSNGSITRSLSFAQLSGIVYFAMMRPDTTSTAFFELMTGTTTVRTRLQFSGGNVLITNGAGNVTVVSGYTTNTWYLFEIEFNNSNQHAVRYNTGSGWSTQTSFLAANNNGNVDAIRLNQGSGGTCYWDTISRSEPDYPGGGYSMTADVGNFTLSGQAVNLKYSSILAAQGSFTLTGQAVNLVKGFRITADVGNFTLTGEPVNLLYNAATLLSGLVAYWKLDESSGNATDIVSSRVLTNNGTITYSAGKINNGSDFGSSNTTKYFSTADAAALDFTTGFTISLWFKRTGDSGTFSHLFLKPSNSTWVSPYFVYGVRITDTDELEAWANSSASGTATTSTGGSFGADGVWKHVVVRFDQTTIEIHVNGAEAATASNTASIANSAQSVVIGTRHATDTGEWYSGMIDEIGLWNRALTLTEITRLYNSETGIQYPFTINYSMLAALGSFSLSGQAVNLLKGYAALVAQVGLFVLNGINVNFRLSAWMRTPRVTDTSWSNTTKTTDTSWINQDRNI